MAGFPPLQNANWYDRELETKPSEDSLRVLRRFRLLTQLIVKAFLYIWLLANFPVQIQVNLYTLKSKISNSFVTDI
jgi:hypothetical protein